MEIKNYGKGCIPTPPEIKQNHYVLGAIPMAAVDWSKPYSIENEYGFLLRQRNQMSSLSCTAQATGYYGEALNFIENKKREKYSNRHIYSQIFLPQGGAYIFSAMRIPVKQGYASADSIPDGDSSEAAMRDISLNDKAIIEASAYKYAELPKTNIDYLAQVIRDYQGFIGGFQGSNDMFEADGTLKVINNPQWGHAVYFCGFEIRNGKKVLKFKNSWGEAWGDKGYGYIPEEFVNSNLFFDAYVYANVQDLNNMYQLVKNPNKPTEIYAKKGTIIRHIANMQSLILGSQDPDKLWTLNIDESGKPDMNSISIEPFVDWATYEEGSEIHLDPKD